MVQGCDKRPLLLWLLVCYSQLLPLLVSAVSYKPRSWLSGSFSIAFLFPNFFFNAIAYLLVALLASLVHFV